MKQNPLTAYFMRFFSFILVLALLSGCVSRGAFSQDTISGPFKDYDTSFRDSVMHRWDKLLATKSPDRYGKIVLRFRLYFDGSISDIRVLEDGMGGGQVAICQKAVSSLAPFPRWPQKMRCMVGDNYRQVTFTFDYCK